MSAAFDISDVVNITQDKIEDGEDILSPLERRKREKEARKQQGHGHIPDYKLNSFFCLTPRNPVRRLCMNIVHHHLLSKFIILTICANCIFLAINKPLCSKLSRSEITSSDVCT